MQFHRSRPLRSSVLTAACLLLLSACASHQHQRPSQPELSSHPVELRQDLVYTPADWPETLHADVWLPASDGDRRPAILLVHGGGWEGRSRSDMNGIAEELATYGFVVVNVSYRLAPAYRFPAPLHDLQQALRWMHAQQQQLGLDSERIAAYGYSAGAHLAALLGLVNGTGTALDQPYGGEAFRLAAVVAGGTPSDLRKFKGGRLVPQFLGGTQEQIPEVFAQASPVVHVHAAAPPFFVYHGGLDSLVPVDHALDLVAALRDAAVPSELYLMHGRGHFSAFFTSQFAVREAARFLALQLELDAGLGRRH